MTPSRRNTWLGAVIALLLLAAVAVSLVFTFSPRDEVLVVPPAGASDVQEGDRVQVTGVLRDFEFEVGALEDREEGEGPDVPNALYATEVQPAPDGASTDRDLAELVDDAELEGTRVTVVGEVGSTGLQRDSFLVRATD